MKLSSWSVTKPKPSAAVLEPYPVRVVTNDDFAAGMSASLRAGVEAVDAAADGYLFALGDMPGVTAGLVDLLCRRFNEAGESAILLPVNEGRRGHPVIFASRYRPELLALAGDRGARSVVERHPGCVVEVPVSAAGILADVDTPEEYRSSGNAAIDTLETLANQRVNPLANPCQACI